MRCCIGLSLALMGLAAGPALGACQLDELAQLPVDMVGLRPTTTVKINGTDVVLGIDTGAFFSMMPAATASQLHLRLHAPPPGLAPFISGIGGNASYSVATADRVSFGPFNLHGVDFIVAGNELGGRALGLIGQNLLRAGDAEYDLANGVMRLIKPKDCGKIDLAYWDRNQPYSRMDIEAMSPRAPSPRGIAYLNGRKISVLFDTGSPLSLLSLRAAERAGVKPGDPDVVPGGYQFGLGQHSVRSWIAPFASFKLGDEEIRHTHLRVADLGRSDIDMFIGADFFLAHHVYVADSQSKLYFTYNGGPVFNLSAYQPRAYQPRPSSTAGSTAGSADGARAAGSDAPTDASGFGRRGAGLLARGDYAGAIADLTRASELDPNEPRYFELRGTAELRRNQPAAALADFNRAIQLKPDDVEALLARSQLRIRAKDRSGALTDLGALDRVLAPQADERRVLAGMYEGLQAYPAAVAQYSLWLDAHRDDVGAASALNGRCWARTLADEQLRDALADCNAAVRSSPTVEMRSAALDSRGLVWLRLGNYSRSAADYTQALRTRPRVAWSLYGRGIDEIRESRQAAGQADLRAAMALQPSIAEEFRQLGLTP